MNESAVGFRQSWRAHENFVMVPIEAIRSLGLTEATIAARIEWRFQSNPGGYKATAADIAEDVGVSVRCVRDVTKRLRERGILRCDRSSRSDATPVWHVLYENADGRHPEAAENVSALTVSAASEVTVSAASSSKTRDKNKTETHASADASEISRLIEHHAEAVASWASRGPRITSATRRVAGRLIVTHGLDHVLDVVDWAQADATFWRSRTMTLDTVSKHWDPVREARRQSRGQRPEFTLRPAPDFVAPF